MTAERDNETTKSEIGSLLIAVAKARIWASEGWKVILTDGEGQSFPPSEFEAMLSRLSPSFGPMVPIERV